jgi:nucleoside-diphosphate-sugar epimerase
LDDSIHLSDTTRPLELLPLPSLNELPEEAPTVPISPYGVAKLAAERYWLLIGAQAGVAATVLRYFNTYGPNQTPTPYVGVITIFIERLLAGGPPRIFGDGEAARDFITSTTSSPRTSPCSTHR